jgi:hypothetical protein
MAPLMGIRPERVYETGFTGETARYRKSDITRGVSFTYWRATLKDTVVWLGKW